MPLVELLMADAPVVMVRNVKDKRVREKKKGVERPKRQRPVNMRRR